MVDIEIDGAKFDTLEGLYAELNRYLAPSSAIRAHCLDSLNDVLLDCFGDPAGGYRITLRNSQLSRARLAHAETARQLEARLAHCHPENRGAIRDAILAAQQKSGPTAFDWVVDIIRDHGHIELRLLK